MAVEIDRLSIALQANFDQLTTGLQQAQRVTDAQLAGIERRFDAFAKTVGGVAPTASQALVAGMSSIGKGAAAASTANDRLIAGMSAFGARGSAAGAVLNDLGQKGAALSTSWRDLSASGHGLELVFASVAGYVGAHAIIDYANAWIRVTRAIDATETEFGVMLKPASELVDLANAARVPLEDYVRLFNRTAASTAAYGLSTSDAAKFTTAFSQTLKFSGDTMQEQASALYEVSHALQRGILNGIEFRSLMRSAPIAVAQLAKNLGIARSALTDLVHEGKVPAIELVKAVLQVSDSISTEFKKMPSTVEEAFGVLHNSVIRYVGELDKAHGTTQALTAGIVGVANHLDTIAVAAAAVLSAASLRMAVFAASAVAAANPLTLIAAAVAALAVAYVEFGDTIEIADGHVATLKTSLEAVSEVIGGDLKRAVNEVKPLLQSVAEEINGILPDAAKSEAAWGSWATAAADAVLTAFPAVNAAVKGAGAVYDYYADRVIKRADEIRQAEIDAAQAAAWQKGTTVDKQNAVTEHPRPKQETDAFTKATNQIAKQTAELKAQVDVIGQSTLATERAKAAADLLAGAQEAAAKKGTSVTTEQRLQILQLADAYSRAKVQLDFLNKVQTERERGIGLSDDINQIGLYGAELYKARTEAELFNEARKAGVDLTPQLRAEIEAIAERNAAQQQYIDMMKDTANLSKDVLGGYLKDIKNGTSATEALTNALNKVSDKLIDIATSNLVDMAFKGLNGSPAGGTGGIVSSLGKIFGFADGGVAAHGMPVPMKRFAGGGVSNTAAIFGEAGPEAAVPLKGGKIPVELRTPNVPTANSSAKSVNLTVAPVFNVQNGTPAGVDKMQNDVVPKIRRLVQSEVAQIFDRKSRFAKSGI